jgi:hypothetical protein
MNDRIDSIPLAELEAEIENGTIRLLSDPWQQADDPGALMRALLVVGMRAVKDGNDLLLHMLDEVFDRFDAPPEATIAGICRGRAFDEAATADDAAEEPNIGPDGEVLSVLGRIA